MLLVQVLEDDKILGSYGIDKKPFLVALPQKATVRRDTFCVRNGNATATPPRLAPFPGQGSCPSPNTRRCTSPCSFHSYSRGS